MQLLTTEGPECVDLCGRDIDTQEAWRSFGVDSRYTQGRGVGWGGVDSECVVVAGGGRGGGVLEKMKGKAGKIDLNGSRGRSPALLPCTRGWSVGGGKRISGDPPLVRKMSLGELSERPG